MSKTAKLASKLWKIPITTSYHTDAPSYSKYYVQKIVDYFPNIISNFFTKTINLAKKVEKKQKKKILDFLVHCEYAMVDQFLSDNLFNLEKINSCMIEKMSRGIDKRIFKKKKINRELFFKKYKIPRKNKLIFFCGRVHELKGSLFLSRIHKSLSKSVGQITTVLAGENINGEECRRVGGKDLRIINHIDQMEVASFLNVCDLFIFPSLYETGPQVVLEAKSCEAVCVVSPSGGGRRIEQNGFDGIIIKRYVLKDWLAEIEDLLKNKKRINSIKNNLRKNFSQPSWKKVFEIYFLKKWKRIYRKNTNDLKMHQR
jgi:glycosyltransferase involved in cell wall biosynthesis